MKENECIKLTTKQDDGSGNSIVTCGFWGTDKCSIHNGGHCENCSVFGIMLAKLNVFETCFEQVIGGEKV